jgi:hypothetical protein
LSQIGKIVPRCPTKVSSIIPVAIAADEETRAKSIVHQPPVLKSSLLKIKYRRSKKIAAEKSAIGK